jgi:hypothetical protein
VLEYKKNVSEEKDTAEMLRTRRLTEKDVSGENRLWQKLVGSFVGLGFPGGKNLE